MKICPVCHQTYEDSSLNFCLNDGNILNQVGDEGNKQQTVYIGQPHQTDNQHFKPANQQNNWQQPQIVRPLQKKSKAWMWVVGVVGGVILLMVIGFIGLIGLAVSLGNTNSNTSTSNTNRYSSNSTGNQKSGAAQTDDFSTWRREVNDIGSSDYKNGEFIATSKREDFYYILMTRNNAFITSNATTKVTVKNVDNKSSRYGFGLVVKANPANSSRYAFLIDSGRESYRVVLHTNNKENTVVNWTKTTAIRAGTQPNELTVSDENGTMKFFINGQSITTVKDSTGMKDGLAGIYTSGAVPIAFSNLQIAK